MLLARRQGLLGRRAARQQAIAPERPAFTHPAFDYENRIVAGALPQVTVASVYVPNGGKDFPAKMRFLGALEQFTARLHAAGVAGRHLRRPQHRAHRHGRASEGAQAERHRPASGGARAARAHHRPRPRRHRPRAGAGERSDVHVVGAVAQHAAAQHRLAARLHARQPGGLRQGRHAASSRATSARAITPRSSESSRSVSSASKWRRKHPSAAKQRTTIPASRHFSNSRQLSC